MKKSKALLYILLTTTTLVGCNKVENSNNTEEVISKQQEEYNTAQDIYFELIQNVESGNKMTIADVDSIVKKYNKQVTSNENIKDDDKKYIKEKQIIVNGEKILINILHTSEDKNSDISPSININLYGSNNDTLTYDASLDKPILTTSRYYKEIKDYSQSVIRMHESSDTLNTYLKICELLDSNKSISINNLEHGINKEFEEVDYYETYLENGEAVIESSYSIRFDNGGISLKAIDDEIVKVYSYVILDNGFADTFEYYTRNNSLDKSSDKNEGYYITTQTSEVSEQKTVLGKLGI